MGIHIRELMVDSFRGIQGLRLKELNHINIIVGNNNSGKTSVLETIQSIESPTSLYCWKDTIRYNYNSVPSLYSGISSLFSADTDLGLVHYSYNSYEGKSVDVKLKRSIADVEISEREIQRINGFIPTGNINKPELDKNRKAKLMAVDVLIDDEKTTRFEIYDFSRRIKNDYNKKSIKTIYVSPVDHFSENPHIDSVLSDLELNRKMINMLKLFDESIEGIQAINTNYGVEHVVISNKHKKALPISVYGDGLRKAMTLVTAAVMAESGILLIDEFETGIHTSVIKDTFKILLDIAMELDEQIFLTTHSKEAIDAVLHYVDDADVISVHTLYKSDDRTVARTMLANEAKHASVEWGVDVRK